MLPDPCTPADIRARLDITQDWWAHNWRSVLVERHGFPQPLPGFKRPFKWNPAHVEAWIAKHHDWLARTPAANEAAATPAPTDAEIFDDGLFAARARVVAAGTRARKPAKVA